MRNSNNNNHHPFSFFLFNLFFTLSFFYYFSFSHLLQQLDGDKKLWLFLVPHTKESTGEYLVAALTECIAPAILAIRDRKAKLRADQATALSQPPPAEKVLPAMLLSCDGEDSHLRAVISTFCTNPPASWKNQGFQVVKYAASASKAQQPCDVSPSFKVLKSIIKTAAKISPLADHVALLQQALKDLDAGSRATYMDFLARFPEVVSTAFNVHNICKGWEIAGYEPRNVERILQRCTTWSELSEVQRKAIIAAVPKLAKHVKENGEIDDETLQQTVGGSINFHTWLEKHTQKKINKGKPLDKQVLNRRRAVWVNHKKVIENYLEMEGWKVQNWPAAPAGAQPPPTTVHDGALLQSGAAAASVPAVPAGPPPPGACGSIMVAQKKPAASKHKQNADSSSKIDFFKKARLDASRQSEKAISFGLAELLKMDIN